LPAVALAVVASRRQSEAATSEPITVFSLVPKT